MTFENIYCATHTRAQHIHAENKHTHVCSSHVWPTQGIAQPPDKLPPTHHTRRRRCPSPSWAATPSRPCQRHYTTHTRCVCLPCVCHVCVCVWVFIWYVVNPTGHIPHRRKGVSCHCHTRLPRPRTKANTHTHTHMSCDWSVWVCAGVKTMYSYFTLHYLPFRQTTTHFRDPPTPPSIHLVSSSPVFALRSPLSALEHLQCPSHALGSCVKLSFSFLITFLIKKPKFLAILLRATQAPPTRVIRTAQTWLN